MKRALRGKGDDVPDELQEYLICKNLGWSYRELMETPYEVVVAFTVIMGLERKEIENENERREREVRKVIR